jgi:hypothetical protein
MKNAYLVFLLLTGCDAFTSVTGRVVDQAGNPVAAADVTLHPDTTKVSDHGTITGADGCFEVSAVHGMGVHFELTVSAPRWKPVHVAVGSKRSSIIQVTLAPIDATADSRANEVARDQAAVCKKPGGG